MLKQKTSTEFKRPGTSLQEWITRVAEITNLGRRLTLIAGPFRPLHSPDCRRIEQHRNFSECTEKTGLTLVPDSTKS